MKGLKSEYEREKNMIELLNMNDKQQRKEYEIFVKNHINGNFMQSLRWTGVKNGWDYEAIIVRNSNNDIIGTALVLIRIIPYLNRAFLYSPHGPVCDYNDRVVLDDILTGIEKLRIKYNAYEVVLDPCITESDVSEINMFESSGLNYIENAAELSTIQARNNYVLKINGRTKEEIFSSFHKKWRYNIRLSERKGVECRVCSKEALDDFYMLMLETGKRDGFCIRSREYFGRMLDSLGEHCRLYMCYYEGHAVSGAIAVQYAGKTCYVYGASTSMYRNVMPNYLMQWNMICWAIENNCVLYDFQGIPFYKDETHPNYGVYRFKRGFNGEVVTYAGEFSKCYNKQAKNVIKLIGLLYRKIVRKNPSELLSNTEKKLA